MSTPSAATSAAPAAQPGWLAELGAHLPTLPQALSSLMRTVVVALFVITFVMQPLMIPSESMERTLLVGDFLLFNKQAYAPSDSFSRRLLPYRSPARGDIVVFHHPYPPMLIKRVVGIPGDRLHIAGGQVFINGVALSEPYAAFEPAQPSAGRDNFPGQVYAGPQVDPDWWLQLQGLTRNGELVVPAGEYFVLGDNRNHSWDSRYWGFVPRSALVGSPLVIYFSLDRPSTTDVAQMRQVTAAVPADDRLGHERELATRLAGFARWRRIFHVVH